MTWTTKNAFAIVLPVVLAACGTGSDIPARGDGVQAAGSGGGGAGDFGNTPQAPDGSGSVSSTGGAGTSGDSCARADVGITRLIPTVQVVVDASGSMAEPFAGCATRWDCLREAMIGDQGLITQLQSTVSFGLTLYGGQIAKVENGVVTEVINAMCPRVLHVPAALDNREAIAMRYRVANPGGGTPTAEALAPIVDALPNVAAQLDREIGPQIILLVTDGDPNVCTDPVMTSYGPAEAEALRAQRKNIKLFTLTVADDQNSAHLQRMANLGAGMPADAMPGAPYFEPTDAAELSQTLREIVGDAVGCDVKLEGTVSITNPGDECRGEVTLNGIALGCNEPDGWRLRDPSVVVLQGEACERFKLDASVVLSADFPCDLVTVD